MSFNKVHDEDEYDGNYSDYDEDDNADLHSFRDIGKINMSIFSFHFS